MAVYNNCFSLYVAMKWAAKPTSPWVGEVWQTGFRLLANTAGQQPVSAGRVEPESFAVQDASVSRSSTFWQISQGWSGVTVGGSTITDADVDDILTQVHDFAVAFATNPFAQETMLNKQYRFSECRIYPMLKGGGSPFRAGISATAPVIAVAQGTSADGKGTVALPPDTSLAVSMGTAVRGPSGRGRMFLGSLSAYSLAGTGLVSDDTNERTRNAASALFNGIRGINSGGSAGEFRFTPVIYTRVPNKAGLNADTASVISSVRVGDEYDTQRRRDMQRQDIYTNGPAIT